MSKISLQGLADAIGAELILKGQSDATDSVSSLSTLSDAKDGQISFLSNSKYRSQLKDTQAMAVILSADDAEHCPCTVLVHSNAYVGFALAAQILDETPASATNIASTAVIHDDVSLGSNVSIGANAVIESGVSLADNVQVGAGCFIGKRTSIGANTKLWANVTVYHEVMIGESCLIQSGAVIGADGFGYANDRGKWVKIPQIGRVVIGNNVEIGASTTIDRGALGDTTIADGVILDNQVQIAHNVSLGENTAIAGCTVVAGSTTIGKNCIFGGLSAINGHMQICDGVTITGMSMVIKDIKEPGVYSSGMPATSNKEWRKNAVQLRNIGSLNQRVKELEKKHLK